MGLYVQSQDCTKLVALGKIHDGPSTIHCVAYANDVVRVSVEKVIDGEAEVPLATSEIKYVRDAINTFIAWPLPLVKLVSNEHSGITPDKVSNAAELNNDVPKHDPLRELIKTLVDIYDKPVEFVWDLTEFGIPNVNSSLFLTYIDVSEITSGDKCLNIAILQLWTMYMNEWIMAWVIDQCMDSLSLNLYTMQRTDVGNVKNISKNGLRNRNDNCT
ncbi:hypothetical protein glysoja_037317 [Glycine soja]|uniref:DUF8039 domain-containing protein n=1 Tax=Glycine soja TaxID=3848 RepID=A0A0B2QRU8_GLYSO|nr:hypothetical protein glysoja_037317 [Glycine soja]